uniref:PX domain-containing protein n=1 Tax=Elaeophora elaphi TaxID=1147741 RepID=A0A0R3S2S5_9BILA
MSIIAMALLDLDNIAPRLEGNSMISIPHYKIKDGKYAVYVIKVTIDSTIWTIEKRYSDFVAFDLQRFEDRKKSFLPPKKLVGNLDSEFLDERRIELEKYIRTVVELDLWLQRRRKQYALPPLIAHFLDFQEYVGVHKLQDSFFRTSEERKVRIIICVYEPAGGFECGYRWRKDEVL